MAKIDISHQIFQQVLHHILALADVYMGIIQVALLWQRDRATRLSVEILQLQNIPIVWHYLRDSTFTVVIQYRNGTHTHKDRRTDTR